MRLSPASQPAAAHAEGQQHQQLAQDGQQEQMHAAAAGMNVDGPEGLPAAAPPVRPAPALPSPAGHALAASPAASPSKQRGPHALDQKASCTAHESGHTAAPCTAVTAVPLSADLHYRNSLDPAHMSCPPPLRCRPGTTWLPRPCPSSSTWCSARWPRSPRRHPTTGTAWVPRVALQRAAPPACAFYHRSRRYNLLHLPTPSAALLNPARRRAAISERVLATEAPPLPTGPMWAAPMPRPLPPLLGTARARPRLTPTL